MTINTLLLPFQAGLAAWRHEISSL